MRILITISRTWEGMDFLRGVLRGLYERHPHATLVHGGARKGDQDAAKVWRSMGGAVEAHPADWDNCGADCKPGHRQYSHGRQYCPYAGLRRNQAMVETAPELVLAFIRDKSKGAADCARRAEDAGLPVERFTEAT
jgi:hypothetical protein